MAQARPGERRGPSLRLINIGMLIVMMLVLLFSFFLSIPWANAMYMYWSVGYGVLVGMIVAAPFLLLLAAAWIAFVIYATRRASFIPYAEGDYSTH